jgi:hypothetical protein
MRETLGGDQRDWKGIASTIYASDLPVGDSATAARGCASDAAVGELDCAACTVAALAGTGSTYGVGVDAVCWCGLEESESQKICAYTCVDSVV